MNDHSYALANFILNCPGYLLIIWSKKYVTVGEAKVIDDTRYWNAFYCWREQWLSLKCYWELLIAVKIKSVNLHAKYDISFWLT